MRLQIEVDWVPTIRCMLSYARDAGWDICRDLTFGGKAYLLNQGIYCVTIPVDESFGDYERRIREAIQVIAYQEKRSEYAVWNSIYKRSSLPQPDLPEVIDAMKRANQFLEKYKKND